MINNRSITISTEDFMKDPLPPKNNKYEPCRTRAVLSRAILTAAPQLLKQVLHLFPLGCVVTWWGVQWNKGSVEKKHVSQYRTKSTAQKGLLRACIPEMNLLFKMTFITDIIFRTLFCILFVNHICSKVLRSLNETCMPTIQCVVKQTSNA